MKEEECVNQECLAKFNPEESGGECTSCGGSMCEKCINYAAEGMHHSILCEWCQKGED